MRQAAPIDAQFSETVGDERLVTVFHPRVDGIIGRNYWRVFGGGVLAFAAAVEFYRQVLGVIRAPLIVATCAGIALALLLPRRRVWVRAEILTDALRLQDVRRQVEVIPWEQVQLIAGEPGISLDGGEIFLWKWVRIVTLRRQYRLPMLQQSSSFYTALLQHAHRAIGVSYADEVHVPISAGRTSMATAEHEATIKAEFAAQTRRAALGAAAMLVASAVAATVLIFAWKNAPAKDHDSLAKVSVAAIVLAVLVPILAGFAWKRARTGQRVIRVLRASEAGQQHHPLTPHHRTVPAVKA